MGEEYPDRRKDEKQEKEEKDRGEREWDKGEQWTGGDALGPLVWGLIIILAGVLALLSLRSRPASEVVPADAGAVDPV